MTWFVTFRSHDERGIVQAGKPLEWPPQQGDGDPNSLLRRFRQAVAYKHLLFVCHGFNVNRADGIGSAVRLEAMMKGLAGDRPPPVPFTRDDCLFVGVLWPGDWYNVLNFPWEARDAINTGNHLADFINAECGGAASISFASHSLGARVILQAAAGVKRVNAEDERPVARIILTAPAADNDCLVRQHAAGFKAARSVHVLSSKRDNVLKFAYPAGDFFSDVFGDGDSPFRGALGYRGPDPAKLTGMTARGIAGKPYGRDKIASDFDHGHYFPPPQDNNADERKKHTTVAHYISAAFAGQSHWP